MQTPTFLDHGQDILRFGQDSNTLNVSSLNQFEKSMECKGFAIKFVTDGVENYLVEKESYHVNKGSYLLLNGEKRAKVTIDSSKNVKGICINIDPIIINSVVSSLVIPDSPAPELEAARFFQKDHFFEHQYRTNQTALGQQLELLKEDILAQNLLVNQINEELFFTLAYYLVKDQTHVYGQLQSIQTIKVQTRRELYKKLCRGKLLMDDCFTQNLQISEIATEATMSDFHFFRLFKRVFGLTPYQYLLQKRLQYARLLLQEGQSVSQTAFDCGFADVFSFSKSFKKQFGTSPSKISSF